MKKVALEIRYLALIIVVITGFACGGGGSDTKVTAPEAIQEAVDAANDPDQIFAVQTSSDSIQGIRSKIPEIFPLYEDLLDGDSESIGYLRDCFQGTPGFDQDMALTIYALVLEELKDTDSLAALQAFLNDNINGELVVSPHVIAHAIKTLKGDSDLEDACYYTGIQMQVALSASSAKTVSNVKAQTKASCMRQYVLVDSQGDPLTYVDSKGTTRNAVVYGTEFVTDQIPDSIRQKYLAEVAEGDGTYVDDDSEFRGSPSKQFNCAGYAFRNFNKGKRWTSDPAMMFDVLTRSGQLVEVAEGDALPGDKVFYFQTGQALPGHVAEVQRISDGIVYDTIVVRNADGQSGLWEAAIDAGYFTGIGWADPRYPSRKVYRWASGSPPVVKSDPGIADNDAYCQDVTNYVYASIMITGYYSTTLAVSADDCSLGMSSITEGGGSVILENIPTFLVINGDDLIDYQDEIIIAFHPDLAGPGTYTSVGDMGELHTGISVGINFSTKSLYDEGNPLSLVYFSAVSGSVELEEFGNQIGDRISGSMNVMIEGARRYCVEGDCDFEETLTGDIVGTFDGILMEYDGEGF